MKKEEKIKLKKIFRFFGIEFSVACEKIATLLKKEKNLKVSVSQNYGEIIVTVSVKDISEEKCLELINFEKEKIMSFLEEYYIGEDDESLEVALLKLLKEKSKQLITVESCTGGLIGEKITAVPGSSENYLGGLITYSNEMKKTLCGVKGQTLEMFGAVSKGTAIEMAEGALKYCNADIAVSVTGLAGPGGATKFKPVGLVYIGVATKEFSDAYRFYFDGNRNEVRQQSANNAIYKAMCQLKNM